MSFIQQRLCDSDKNGESCDPEKTCDSHLRCQSASSKCGCSTGMKEFTSKMWDDGVEETRQRCIHDKGTAAIFYFLNYHENDHLCRGVVELHETSTGRRYCIYN